MDILLLLFWFILCGLVAGLASSRGRSAFGFFALSFFLSPLVGLIVLMIVRNLAAEQREERVRRNVQQRSAGTLQSVAGLLQSSVADEIRKLAELRANGTLTLDEFALQKTKLLAQIDRVSASALGSVTCARCSAAAPVDATICPGCGAEFDKRA